jgi:hypothetical protein
VLAHVFGEPRDALKQGAFMPSTNQGRQFACKQVFTGVANDGVETVVDDRPSVRALTVFLHHDFQGSTDLLSSEADDRRRPDVGRVF